MSYVSYGIESFNNVIQGSNSGSFSLGIRFQLAEARKVSGFRIFSSTRTESVTIKLWDSNKTLIASASGSKVKNDWSIFPLDSSIILDANTEYRLAYYTKNSVYEWFNLTSIVTSKGFTLLGGCEQSGDAYPDNNDSMFWGLDLVFDNSAEFKYLIKSNSILYTIKDNILTELEDVILNEDVFKTYGIDNIPDWNVMKILINPQILCWTSEEAVPEGSLLFSAHMKAISSIQTLITNAIDLNDSPNITGINQVTLDSDGDILIAVSFDEKNSWLIFNGINWNITTSDIEGMNKETLEAITSEQWATALGDSKTIYFKAIFSNVDDALRKINIEFLMS